jgi:hypothetical protein
MSTGPLIQWVSNAPSPWKKEVGARSGPCHPDVAARTERQHFRVDDSYQGRFVASCVLYCFELHIGSTYIMCTFLGKIMYSCLIAAL